jgi:hypothetical protein
MKMAATIQKIFIDPPIAIARLGGSSLPQNAYRWVEDPNPRGDAETAIMPDWSLVVQGDGTVVPWMPPSLALRDGALIRPVCPFFELWASMGEPSSKPSTWTDVPVTPKLLSDQGINLNTLVVTLDAKNFKVFRRTGNPELRYGTFTPVEIKGDDHEPKPILAGSPPKVPATRRMIPSNQNIPLGSFQMMQSLPQPAPDPNLKWTLLQDGFPVVDVEVIRFRFTPARGHFYGPPDAAQPQDPGGGVLFPPVEATRAFLNQNAGWFGFNANATAPDAPSDTYDGADVGRSLSLGVVDDTCEVRIDVSLPSPTPAGQPLTASANVFVGPPDFAPDRRPFLSLADEINDRSSDNASRTKRMSNADCDAWVEDLFERIYETLSLMNLDLQRRGKAILLRGDRLAPAPIAGDLTRSPSRAMGGLDVLRNKDFPIPAANDDIKLPLTDHAHTRHRKLSSLADLRDFVSQNPGRLATLIRQSFEAEAGELSDGIGTTTMRMPPFMRNSNAGPLTLAAWQYDLLMAWVTAVETLPKATADARKKRAARQISDAAAKRRAHVLTRIARGNQGRPSGGR